MTVGDAKPPVISAASAPAVTAAHAALTPQNSTGSEPCHLNYDLLGNLVPHVHTHIVPRYVDDSSPNMPLKPWEPVPIPEAELRDQVARLRAVFSDSGSSQ